MAFFFLNIPFLHLQQNEWNSEKLQVRSYKNTLLNFYTKLRTQECDLDRGNSSWAQPQLGLARQRFKTGFNSPLLSTLSLENQVKILF